MSSMSATDPSPRIVAPEIMSVDVAPRPFANHYELAVFLLNQVREKPVGDGALGNVALLLQFLQAAELDHPQDLQSVTNFADCALRVELTLRGMELDRLGLSEVQNWSDGDFEQVYISYLSGLEFSQNMKATVTIDGLEKLPARLRACVLAWSEGHDLRELYPRASWYRYRKEIMKFINLDISLPSPKQLPDSVSNVVPLFTVIDAKPMSVPAWAHGTPLYFEPPVYPRVLAAV